MIIRGISIRSKLIIATSITVGVLLAMSLLILDSSDQLREERKLLEDRSEMISRMRALEQTFYSSGLIGNPGLQASLIQETQQLEASISTLTINPVFADKKNAVRAAEQILSSLQNFVSLIRTPIPTDDPDWLRAETELLVLGEQVFKFNRELSANEVIRSSRHKQILTSLMITGILATILLLGIMTYNISRSFSRLINHSHKIRKGGLPPPVSFPPGDELSQLADNIDAFSSNLREKIDYISSLSGEDPINIYNPHKDDEVGSALVVLYNYLNKKGVEEKIRNREDRKQNWISAGNAQIGEVLRTERKDVKELSFSVIQKLVSYLNVEMGSLFIASHADPDHPTLELTASYAYDRRKYQNRILEWGSELPGTCAQEKKKIFLTEVPEQYFEISSGTGSARPNCLLIVPMIIDDLVCGVIELATVRLLRPFEIEFVESLAKSIASSIQAVQSNERTSELLKQSSAQAETLQAQEAILRENMQELELAQEESKNKALEISGVLQAINQSTYIAELGLNGRYTSINDKFLMLLEAQSDQVLGKLYTEFSQADPSSDEYKSFWKSLKAGDSISNTETYKLLSGKEIYLRQTFTPVLNDVGKVYKIINIAEDITLSKGLQKSLETRKNEITRAGLDFQTLNDAVNSALIKCELDPEGIIIQVNEKYSEITGYSRKELLGRNYRLFLKESEKEQFEIIWSEVSKQKVYEGVIRRTKPTGEEVWLVSTLSPVIDESGVIYKVYFMGFDITEKKLKYQLLEDANREIERLKQEIKDYESN